MKKLILTAFFIILSVNCVYSQSARLKDIASIDGVRGNQLLGYGLVIGLEGTGDSQQTKFTNQALANMLDKFGILVSGDKIKVKNVAAVIISANLPPFAKPGSMMDVTVSSLGDAASLQGGTLLQTPLKAGNGNVYAVAQGTVSIGGFLAGGAGGSVTKNFQTVGRIINGAIIEKATTTEIEHDGSLNINLNTNDFTNATRIADSINATMPEANALAIDSNTIKVKVPDQYKSNIISFISSLESVTIAPDSVAKVVVNERTGTIIIGGSVKLTSCAISHGSLTVEIRTDYNVSQPVTLSKGDTVVVPTTDVKVKEQPASLVGIKGTTTIDELTRALNALKVTPRDLIAILQAIKQAGALQAQLEII